MTADLHLIAAAVKRAGFGPPEREYRFHPVRKWRFDLAWPELRVAFEREGGSWQGGRHTRGKGYASDCEKYNAAAIAGWLIIRATVDMIRGGLALTQLLDALRVREESS